MIKSQLAHSLDQNEPTIEMLVSPLQKSQHYLTKSIVSDFPKYTKLDETAITSNDLENILISDKQSTKLSHKNILSQQKLDNIHDFLSYGMISLQMTSTLMRLFNRPSYPEIVQIIITLVVLAVCVVVKVKFADLKKIQSMITKNTFDVCLLTYGALICVLFKYNFSSKISIVYSSFCLLSLAFLLIDIFVKMCKLKE